MTAYYGLASAGPEYAGHLLELVRTMRPGPQPALTVAMAHRSHLESRLVALLDAGINRKKLAGRGRLPMVLAATALLFPSPPFGAKLRPRAARFPELSMTPAAP